MKTYFSSSLGFLRLLAMLEGSSLLALVFIAMPFKYFMSEPSLVKSIGPVHGVLFLLFITFAIIVSVIHKWNFFRTTWKVLIACLIPFGTFFVDYTILRPMYRRV